VLDYDALDLHRFYPGALVRHGGKWHRVANPFRHPIHSLRGAFNPIGTFTDKLRAERSFELVHTIILRHRLGRIDPIFQVLFWQNHSPA
jgi:hypothetical protein